MRQDEQARWFALMTGGAAGFVDRRRAFAEFAAVARLGDAGVEAFAPTARVLVRPHRHAKRRVTRLVPLFPGYCFARFDGPLPSRERLALWREVVDIVRVGGEPAQIPLDQIDLLRALSGCDIWVDASGEPKAISRRPIRVGDKVEYTAAAWDGFRFEVESIAGEKAVLVLRLFAGTGRITAPVAELHAVGGIPEDVHA